eukprot:COSAG01_NODE_3024_length_6708_cov_23.565138_3_plen_362_part_00
MTGYHRTHHTQGSRIIYINSEDADKHHTTHTTHFTISFKDALHTRKGEAMLVSLHSASVPYSFYNIRTGVNDQLTYTIRPESTAVGSTTHTLTFPAGNYNVNSLRAKVNADVKTNLDAYIAGTTFNAHTFEMTFDPPTQKFHFTLNQNGAGAPLRMDLDFAQPRSPAIEMGFEASTYTLSPTVGNSGASGNAPPLASINVADINGSVHALYLRTDIPTRSIFDSSGAISDVLGKIALSTNPGGIIALQPSENTHSALVVVNHIKTIEIRVTDERNRLLDLNGLHFQFGILFQFVEMFAPSFPPDQRLLGAQPAKPAKPSTAQRKRAKRRRALHKGKAKVRRAQELASKTQQASPPPETKTA